MIGLPFQNSPRSSSSSSLWFVRSDTPLQRPKNTLQEYFLALPKPVLSDDDLKVALNRPYNPPSQIWRIWSTDPIKAAVLQAISSCWDRFGYGQSFGSDIAKALAQKPVCSLHSNSLEAEEVHY